MKKLMALIVVALLAVLALGIGLQAQDGSPTLEDVAANSSDYYGQQISLTGTIENFLSPHIFILGEDALLDNDQVLVINRTGQVFPMNIAEGSTVTVTGTIYPSRNVWNDGTYTDGFNDFTIDTEVGNNEYYGSLLTSSTDPANPNAVAEATSETGMTMTNWGSFDVDTTSYFYNGWMLEDYADYTVMVLTSVNSVTVAPQG